MERGVRRGKTERKRIAICRLRQNVTYTVPLTTILDSFYECLFEFMKKHDEYEYLFHRFSFSPLSSDKPSFNPEALKKADIIIIPSEAEFNYWIPGKLHGVMVKRSNAAIDGIKKYFKNKRVILLRSDRADNTQLYRALTFKGIPIDFKVIDEDEFPLGIHGMKYHFIKQHNRYFGDICRNIDFGYWGSDKRKLPDGSPSGDLRHVVLKEIQDSGLSSQYWGAIYGIKDHLRWSNDFRPVVRSLLNVRSTLCFNWLDANAVTSRYGEALACGVMPFVWQDYDKQGKLVSDDWQRVTGSSELIQKLSDRRFNKRILEITRDYESRLPSMEQYKALFEEKLMKLL